jgi:AraC-like DNA-binding protein
VAFACRFSTPQYFSRVFRKAFGMPPRAFRERLPLIP